jgi:hypothetical protein
MDLGSSVRPLLRADSAFYGHATIGTAIKAGADVSVTVRMDPAVKTAIATIPEDGWETIEYPNAIRDEVTGRWISKAEVAEVPFTAFRSRKIASLVFQLKNEPNSSDGGPDSGRPLSVRIISCQRVVLGSSAE